MTTNSTPVGQGVGNMCAFCAKNNKQRKRSCLIRNTQLSALFLFFLLVHTNSKSISISRLLGHDIFDTEALHDPETFCLETRMAMTISDPHIGRRRDQCVRSGLSPPRARDRAGAWRSVRRQGRGGQLHAAPDAHVQGHPRGTTRR